MWFIIPPNISCHWVPGALRELYLFITLYGDRKVNIILSNWDYILWMFSWRFIQTDKMAQKTTSLIWNHFLKENSNLAKCTNCGKKIFTKNYNTKGLWSPLKSILIYTRMGCNHQCIGQLNKTQLELDWRYRIDIIKGLFINDIIRFSPSLTTTPLLMCQIINHFTKKVQHFQLLSFPNYYATLGLVLIQESSLPQEQDQESSLPQDPRPRPRSCSCLLY